MVDLGGVNGHNVLLVIAKYTWNSWESSRKRQFSAGADLSISMSSESCSSMTHTLFSRSPTIRNTVGTPEDVLRWSVRLNYL